MLYMSEYMHTTFKILRHLRVSLWALMIAVLGAGALLGLVMRRVQVQREVAAVIQGAGGRIYHFQRPRSAGTRPFGLAMLDSWGRYLVPGYAGPIVSVLFDGGGDGTGPDDATLGQIARVDTIEEIDFSPATTSLIPSPSWKSVTDSGLVYLRKLPRLQRLNLSRTGVSGQCLASLSGLTQLRELKLIGVPVNDNDLSHVNKLMHLECLSLDGATITDKGLTHLAGLVNLRFLSLSHSLVTGEGLDHLRRLGQLLHLDVSYTRVEEVLPLTQLTSLESLNLSHTLIEDSDLEIIGKLSDLELLWLGGTRIHDEGLSHLSKLTRLTLLDLSDTLVSDHGLPSLAGLLRCESLFLIRTRVTCSGVAWLSGNLHNIRIYR